MDKLFLKQLIAILRIVFPSWRSKEIGILLLHTFFLVTRTVLSVYVAHLDGKLVRDIVSADGQGFLRSLAWWFALAVPSSYTNSMVSHHIYLFRHRLLCSDYFLPSCATFNLNYQYI